MAEIKTPVELLPEGLEHVAGADEYLITSEHTIADVLRWLVMQAGGAADIRMLLDEGIEPQSRAACGRRLH